MSFKVGAKAVVEAVLAFAVAAASGCSIPCRVSATVGVVTVVAAAVGGASSPALSCDVLSDLPGARFCVRSWDGPQALVFVLVCFLRAGSEKGPTKALNS